MKGVAVTIPTVGMLRCMTAEQRRREFPGAVGMLPEELEAQAKKKGGERSHKKLQTQILALLEGHKGIVVVYSRMDRKTSNKRGVADLLFAVHGTEHHGMIDAGTRETRRRCVYPCAWEIKTGDDELSKEQIKFRDACQSGLNAWRWREINTYDQALAELREMGVE